MTRENLAQIDDLIDWLDNQADGAPDAGALAQNATNWHPALVALRKRMMALQAEVSMLTASLRAAADRAKMRTQERDTVLRYYQRAAKDQP
jgi:hypothetical protein